jgi:uncharacterized protein (DUF1330 family)
MKTNAGLVLAVLVGISVGVAGAKTVLAQREKPAPGYVISEVDAILDMTALQKYAKEVPETLAPFNGHFIVRGSEAQALEGEPPKGIVVVAFDSAAKAREWYDSHAYQAIKPLRQNSTKGRMFIVEGIAVQ